MLHPEIPLGAPLPKNNRNIKCLSLNVKNELLLNVPSEATVTLVVVEA